MGEQERIELLARVLAPRALDGVSLGIGDDCAVLTVGQGRLAWSVDVMVEEVHFRRPWLTLQQLGYRASMAALSDLAAMGVEPRGVLASLVLPSDVGDGELEALARGQAQACAEVGTQVIGGNLARGGELSITTTVLGQSQAVLERGRAEPGDALWVTGPLGLAGAGLALLQAGADGNDEAMRAALSAWRSPRAHIAAGVHAAPLAHAAIDVSDGLAHDAAQLCGAGVRLCVDAEALRVDALLAVADRLACDAVELALWGGEDYALLVAAPPDAELNGFRVVGHFEPADDGEQALWLHDDGTRQPLDGRGFDHFG